jgi:hypothetical protein
MFELLEECFGHRFVSFIFFVVLLRINKRYGLAAILKFPAILYFLKQKAPFKHFSTFSALVEFFCIFLRLWNFSALMKFFCINGIFLNFVHFPA